MSKRTPEQAIIDLISFCSQNNKYPNQKSNNIYEKSLATCVSNYKRNRKTTQTTFSDEQFIIVQELQSTYSSRSPQKKPSEKLSTLRNFCIKEERWPSQNSTNKTEKKIYESCCRTIYYTDNQHLLNEYNQLKSKYMSLLSPSNIVEELSYWVDNHNTTPRENSKNEKESKLAKNIKYLKTSKKFNDDELRRIEYIYDKFGPSGGTSICEQILYYYLLSTSTNSLVTNRNSERYGSEVDVLIENISKTIAIFYDGSFFHQDVSKDNNINKKLKVQDPGIIILRFREEGCPKLNDYDCINIPVPKGISYQDFLDEIDRYFKSCECPINDIISPEDIDHEEILNSSRIAGSSNYLVRAHLLKYIENALLTTDKPKTNSKIYRNCKACLQRNQFTDKEQLLYAFTKRLYDSSPRTKRDIDAPSMTNDDIELLTYIIQSIFKNTPYNHDSFKKNLIAQINDMI